MLRNKTLLTAAVCAAVLSLAGCKAPPAGVPDIGLNEAAFIVSSSRGIEGVAVDTGTDIIRPAVVPRADSIVWLYVNGERKDI